MDDEKKRGRGLEALIPRKNGQYDYLTSEEMMALMNKLDELLGRLPEKEIEEFSKTDEFRLYERLMGKYRK